MGALLSICVPTFNRPDDLRRLHDSFIARAVAEFDSEVEVIVCDNSDELVANRNREVCAVPVGYFWNGENIGFGRNVLQCAVRARGTYLWIISDNDIVLWNGFERLLERLREKSSDCVFVPYVFETLFGERLVNDFGGLKSGPTIRDALVSLHSYIPFIFLGEAVVRRREEESWADISGFQDNNVAQIPLYLGMLRPESSISVLEMPAIDYKTEYDSRFNRMKSFDDLLTVVEFMHLQFKVPKSPRIKKIYRDLLCAFPADSSRVHRVAGISSAKRRVISMGFQYLSVRAVPVYLLMFLTKRLQGFVWIVYMSLRYAIRQKHLGLELPRRFLSGYRMLVLRRYAPFQGDSSS